MRTYQNPSRSLEPNGIRIFIQEVPIHIYHLARVLWIINLSPNRFLVKKYTYFCFEYLAIKLFYIFANRFANRIRIHLLCLLANTPKWTIFQQFTVLTYLVFESQSELLEVEIQILIFRCFGNL